MINKKRLIELTQKLIQINSENPPGDERAIALFVKDYLGKIGLKSRIYEFKKRRSNIVATLQGRNKKHSLLITPHLDTVPAGKNWRFNPFSAKIFKRRIYGLGATDCKGNLACAIEVINSLIEDKVTLDYNLIFSATSDEESGSIFGLIPLLKKGILNPDAVLVLDSDDFNIIITQKGLMHLKVKLEGKRAHGAYPWRGLNAIDMAVSVIAALKKYKISYKENRHLHPPTLNIGTIKGGDKVNIVADWCEFELDFRFLPGMSSQKILKDIKKIIAKYARNFKLEIEGIQQPYSISERHPLVKGLVRAMKNIKIKPLIKGSEGATTITFFQDKNIPAIATGFGNEKCAHVSNEYAKTDTLYRGALVLEEFLKNYRFN